MRDSVINSVQVPSFSNPDVRYTVTESGGRLSCSCPAVKRCKHIEIVERANAMLARCKEKHGSDGSLCRVCFVAILATAAKKVVVREKAIVRETKQHMREVASRRKEGKR